MCLVVGNRGCEQAQRKRRKQVEEQMEQIEVKMKNYINIRKCPMLCRKIREIDGESGHLVNGDKPNMKIGFLAFSSLGLYALC